MKLFSVEEDEIAEGLLFLMENQKVISEGSGAVTTAALLSEKYKPKANENVVCIISGGNIDVNTLSKIILAGLTKSGRRFTFYTNIKAQPGGLAELSKIITGLDGNLISVNLSAEGVIGKLDAKMVIENI